jgi:gamma-glutamylcyclotransferase (GGCT)/AIG2-like uncharacterized protein YtfP/lysophospholipase L1-like esterase
MKLFVYGTLKRGECRSHVLRSQTFLGEVLTAARYRLFDTGSYPALVEDADGLAIEGELWEVDESCLKMLDAIEGVPDLYRRQSMTLDKHCAVGEVQTYIYQRSTVGMRDCGTRWDGRGKTNTVPAVAPLYVAHADEPEFDVDRHNVAILCVGDSITGWNNFGPRRLWPLATYPEYLQVLSAPRGWLVADGGIAGEVSSRGPLHLQRYLELFPAAEHVLIGFGTNDLAEPWDPREISARIIANLDTMVTMVRERGSKAILFNVPHVRRSALPSQIFRECQAAREHHNSSLAGYCHGKGIPLADVCSQLGDEHLADELHPNEHGAKIIAEELFCVLAKTARD